MKVIFDWIKKGRKIAPIAVMIGIGILLFQNFKWYDLVRGGPGNETFELYDLDKQINWLASVNDSKLEITRAFAALSSKINSTVGTITANTTATPEAERIAWVINSEINYLNRMITKERTTELNPTFYYMQDRSFLKGKLPVVPFSTGYAFFDQYSNVLNKGNEEFMAQIRDWRWEAMYRDRYISAGGSPYVMLKIYADPEPLVNSVKHLVAGLNSGSTPAALVCAYCNYTDIPQSVKVLNTVAANKLKNLRMVMQNAINRASLFKMNAYLTTDYITKIDEAIAIYNDLGVENISAYTARNPNLYNGEDINPILFDYSIPPNLGTPDEIEEYLRPEDSSTVRTELQTLRLQKSLLINTYGPAKWSWYRDNGLISCRASFNALVAAIPVDLSRLDGFVTRQSAEFTGVVQQCQGAFALKLGSFFYLSRISSVTRSHIEYLKYLKRQKDIEVNYQAKRAQLAGTELGVLINFVETNSEWISTDLFSLSILSDSTIYMLTRYYGPNETRPSFSDVSALAFTMPETSLDLPSSLRKLVISKDLTTLRSIRLPSNLMSDLTYFQGKLGCKRALESRIGELIRTRYESSNYPEVESIINTMKSSDPLNYCMGLYQPHTDFRAGNNQDGLMTPEQIQEIFAQRAQAFYFKVVSVRASSTALFSNIRFAPLVKPQRGGRSMGSYFSSPCEKAVLKWKRNPNYARSTSIPGVTDMTLKYVSASNPACFGIEGGVSLAVRDKIDCSDPYRIGCQHTPDEESRIYRVRSLFEGGQ